MSTPTDPVLLVAIIDDDDAARRMMRRVLERRGYRVADASSGADGITLVKNHLPQIVLLDLRMPGEFSGFDVARNLRGDSITSSIPIVVVSASAYADARSLVEQIGCDAFLEKPVDFDLLEQTLRALTKQN